MIRPNTKALDDIAGLAGGIVNIVSSLRGQIKQEIKSRIEEAIDRMDLVNRQDFDDMKAELSDLRAKVATYEGTQKSPAKTTSKTVKKTIKKSPAKSKSTPKSKTPKTKK